VRSDHRPLWLKRGLTTYHRLWAERFLYPQFEGVGSSPIFFGPQHIEVNGPRVYLGNDIHMMATRDNPIRFTVYAGGRIELGDCTIVLPGARLSAASRIRVGKNCMFATNCYVTDADWHDVYDRTAAPGSTAEVVLEDNVWIGDSAIVCKGVTIGENSVIGAGAVVAGDIPRNSIAAGNPARVIRQLDPTREIIKRESLFAREMSYDAWIAQFERYVLAPNTLTGWVKSKLLPTRDQ
jgi:acetyltransferase-like isoleucine patch superfamily enzyme